MNKTALFLSVALTVLVLIAAGAIVLSMRSVNSAEGAAAASPAETVDPGVATDPITTATIDPQLEKIWMEREAAYQQTIAEANARLDQLQQQLTGQTATPAAAPQTGPITPEQAAAIAADSLGQTSVYSVTLVTLGGGSVYEVMMPSGDIVYVSLDGQVVGSVPATVYSSSGGGGGGKPSLADLGGGNNGEHEGEHEGDDD